MSKDELREALKQTSTGDRDDIEDLIICGPTEGPIRRPARLLSLGLIMRVSYNNFRYAGGPISQFFEVRLESNFA